jgi:hypothetical protein
MSLSALPVSVSDLTTLQQGIQFFTNTAEAMAEAAAINTPGSGETVASYAATLLENNISTSQVAMAVSALAERTIAIGDASTPNTLTHLSTQFLPDQVAYANAHGLNPTVYAAQALGLSLSGTGEFQFLWGSLNASGFEAQASAETGVHTNALDGWLNYWEGFYNENPSALHGLTATQAAYGATLGEAIGVGLLNFTGVGPTGLKEFGTVIGLETTVQGEILGGVANALLDIANGTYKSGWRDLLFSQHIP